MDTIRLNAAELEILVDLATSHLENLLQSSIEACRENRVDEAEEALGDASFAADLVAVLHYNHVEAAKYEATPPAERKPVDARP
ncbi:hypothetical protein [Anaeromyxobacter sp. SG26]|uniref:hypothetical protein n=1 Tax=Anaeromyxobacter sp. SG26 TaxID=2925407 RepID=UPI001F5661E6|nr:hypothetical protein [Anaeromyxobacter sp. SG26]